MSTKQPHCIDILQLLHDIHITHKNKPKFRHCLDQIQLTNTKLSFHSRIEITERIKEIVNQRKKKHLPTTFNNDETPKSSKDIPINWLAVFYNKNFTDISQRLSIISPILSLYKQDKTIDTNHTIDIEFDTVQTIRKYIPYSSNIKGIENNNYLSLNVEQLFGEFKILNIDHLSIDLCKQIVSYLDLPTFFKCSLINHCWLNFIYRNDTFFAILKQYIHSNSLKCVIVDHSSLNRMESIYLSKIFINWQLRSTSSYLDFITLQKSWIGQYINPNTVKLTLEEFKPSDENDTEYKSEDEWIQIKTVESNSKKLFDSMDVFDVKSCVNNTDAKNTKDDEKKHNIKSSNNNNLPLYRLQIHIKKPFEWIFYSEPRHLNPFSWHKKYHSHSIGIANEQQFWFEYYLELLYSMIDTDISQALVTIMEAAQRMRFDHEFVLSKLLNINVMRQIIRLINHKDWRIQHNAAILLANLFATNQFIIREKYLEICTFGTEYNIINVTMNAIYAFLNGKKQFELQESEYRVCRSLICVIGNYVISKDKNDKSDKWKKIALLHNINYVPFMIIVLNKEANFIQKQSPINVWSFRAMAIWSLSTFYRHGSQDNIVNQILNKIISRKVMNLFLDWTVIVGYEYLLNDKQQHKKMNKFLNKLNKTQQEFEKEQRCFSTVLAEACIGIQRIFASKYDDLGKILDVNIAKKITNKVLHICVKGIHSDWAQYLTHLSLKLIAQTLRVDDDNRFVKEYIESKLAIKLYDILEIIKKALPNEKSFVNSVRNWIKRQKSSDISNNVSTDSREIQKINSFIELYDDIIDITNAVTKYKEFNMLTTLILDVLCIYSQRGNKCEEQYLQHSIAYLWNSLTHNPIIYKKIILKHKTFMKLLNNWSNNNEYGVVFNGVVQNIQKVLKDNNLFRRTFSNDIMNEMDMNDDEKDDEKKNDIKLNINHDEYCPCGQKLQLLAAKDCYENSQWLYCDLCFQKISGDTKVFHCERKKPQHENGYDLCITCSKRRALIKSSST